MDHKAKRTRIRAPKSRRGCSRCKSRRIRCDESHPSCQNCTKLGYQCPGFQQQLRWSKKHERLQQPVSSETPHDKTNNCNGLYLEAQNTEIAPEQSSSHVTDLFGSSDMLGHDIDPLAKDNGLVWLPASPATLPISSLDFAQWLNDYDERNTANYHDAPDVYEPQVSVPGGQSATILQAPAHVPTMLVEHWFQHVCPLWSTFDSAVNYNRQLAWSSWSTSKAVFYTIQAMSAARLSVTTPYYRDIMLSLRRQAIGVIDEGIRLMRGSKNRDVKSDLVYALFTLANSSHFTAPTLSEYPWLDAARELLSAWKPHSASSEALFHTYFCQALSYWEMLLATGGLGSVPGKVEKKRRHCQVRIRRAMRLQDLDANEALLESNPHGPQPRLLGTRPNSWSGASSEVIDVFGEVLALCHDAYHSSKRGHGLTSARASHLLCNLSLAHELQRELLNMDFECFIQAEELGGFNAQTQDEKTPMTHLLQTAEAYRQAALLQLHLTFSDLQKIEEDIFHDVLETQHNTATDDTSLRTRHLNAMTLKLVATLEQIPVESGSRSIHLMLYLCAATGLRLTSFFESWRDYHVGNEPEVADIPSDSLWDCLDLGPSLLSPDLTTLPFPEVADDQTTLMDTTDTAISRSALEISRARDVVFTRLSSFQQTLPHRRIDDTLQFVRAIWKEYDDQKSDYFSIAHWLDTMGQRYLFITLW